jgi:signal peptidase I
MSTEKPGQAETLSTANDQQRKVDPAETLLHAQPAEGAEGAPAAAADPAQPAYVADPAGRVAAAPARASFSTADPLRPKAPTAAQAVGAGPKPGASEAGRPSGSPPSAAEPEVRKEDWVEILKTVGFALLIALVLRSLLFQPFTIPSASMEPNLYEGDYLVVSKWTYGYSRFSMPFPALWPIHGRAFNHPAHRGDIVVFKLPSDTKIDYIKRVIGVPGDQIQMRDGLLYINGQPVKDVKVGETSALYGPGIPHQADLVQETLSTGKTFMRQDIVPNAYDAEYVTKLDNTATFTVPPHEYFMMGDNRRNSDDSRADVGFVPEANLEGKAQMVLFSWYPGASLWKPWTWVTKLRFSRFFKPLV